MLPLDQMHLLFDEQLAQKFDLKYSGSTIRAKLVMFYNRMPKDIIKALFRHQTRLWSKELYGTSTGLSLSLPFIVHC